MSKRKAEHVTAWRTKAAEVPAPDRGALQLGCVYELDIGVDTVDEAVYFMRRRVYDELWVEDALQGGTWRAARMKRQGLDERASCLRMFERFVRSRSGYAGPGGVQVPGLIEAADVEALNAKLDAEWQAAQQAAELWRSAPIIRTAEELGLGPRPSGGTPVSWEAHCPGTNHSLMIQARSGQWGCGWCRRKGEGPELRAFVAERRRARR